MTVDLSGSVWLVGKKSNAYSLFKVVKAPCAAGLYGAHKRPAGVLCPCVRVRPPAAGRYLAGGRRHRQQLPAWPGIIGLEGSNTVTFFSKTFGVSPTVIASGKSTWGLSGNEALQGVGLLQRTGTIETGPNAGTYTDNFVVATTTTGRVLAKQVSSAATTVFNTNFLATSGRGSACPGVAAGGAIRRPGQCQVGTGVPDRQELLPDRRDEAELSVFVPGGTDGPGFQPEHDRDAVHRYGTTGRRQRFTGHRHRPEYLR